MAHMIVERSRVDGLRALWWIAASGIGFGLVGAFFHFPSGFPPNNGAQLSIGGAVFGFIGGTLSGVAVGLLQWLALRHWLPHASRWIWMTAIGLGLIHAAGDGLPDPIAIPLVQIFGGLVLGVMQWLVLRREFAYASRWVWASGAGWFMGLSLGLGLARSSGLMQLAWTPAAGAAQHAIVGVVTGLVSGLITAVAWIWLRRTTKTSEISIAEDA